MKNVSLSTSKNNYIDPRIIFSFIYKFDIPVDKIFSKPLIERFKWASDVDKDYKFQLIFYGICTTVLIKGVVY